MPSDPLSMIPSLSRRSAFFRCGKEQPYLSSQAGVCDGFSIHPPAVDLLVALFQIALYHHALIKGLHLGL